MQMNGPTARLENYDQLPVLISGGAGFIGSHLAELLVSLGAKVRIIDNFSCGDRRNLAAIADNIELYEGDIRNVDDSMTACRGCKVIFHLAGLSSVTGSMAEPAVTIAVNLSGAASLYQAAKDGGAERIVYASSASVYGDNAELPLGEEAYINPLSMYGVSKSLLEALSDAWAKLYHIETVGLRYFNVYGPRMKFSGAESPVVAKFIQAIKMGKPPTIYGDGKQTRDMIFVADVVEATARAGVAPVDALSKKYNIAMGEAMELDAIVDQFAQILKRRINCSRMPIREGEILHSLAAIERARQELNFKARIDFKTGLIETLRYYGIAT